MPKKVVAHFIDDRIVKGTSVDVAINKPICHIRTDDEGPIEVSLQDLKALYFVNDLAGNREYRDSQEVHSDDLRVHGSRQIEITFRDGERLGALTNRYPPLGDFFFVLPLDTKSNNQRILVNRAAVATIAVKGDRADAPAPPKPTPPPSPASRPSRRGWVFDGKQIR